MTFVERLITMSTYKPFRLDAPSILLIEDWNQTAKTGGALTAGFTTKNGGESEPPFQSLNTGLHVQDHERHVANNRKKVAEILQTDLNEWVFADQTHEDRIQKVTHEHRGRGALRYETALAATDGLYTNETNLFLALCFADCVPVYFYDPVRSLVGIAHAGWKGTVKGIAGKMIETWKSREGSNPGDIHAVIGPSIGACCYTVDDHVISKVRQLPLQEQDRAFVQIKEGEYRLELKEVNRQLLLHAGIPDGQIKVSSLCTSCERSLFFSHRRDRGKTGRMMSFIGLKEV
ncbi:laccase domain-containing protein [Bacillus sonorensis]|uniref:Purine nucleoside phosphorylase n=3 Tax=Bacillaceae TaxID=186817 RepID=M5PD34_9BACI|nr:Laccase domain protein YlmD [Bacillus sonorensis]EME74380.1 polyphenol oxidoreductase YlmD [Bacillus sonorensis L12]TWK77999.1 Laccase domain protein YfiH [Bacillus paralicheniformis]PAD61597.1 laccase domain-containing protein [Bacillus sonorensis]RHJ13236.1 peptidoglycan editing factor PgeF [Bacillus sonorensis]